MPGEEIRSIAGAFGAGEFGTDASDPDAFFLSGLLGHILVCAVGVSL